MLDSTTSMQQLFRGTSIFLVALAWPVYAQENLPFTTYTNFDQVLEARNARYPTMTRVSDWFTDASEWDKETGEAANFGGYGGMDKLTALILESLLTSSATA